MRSVSVGALPGGLALGSSRSHENHPEADQNQGKYAKSGTGYQPPVVVVIGIAGGCN
jgi:hypothetical protein